MANLTESPAVTECVTPGEESYGESAIGEWLRDLLVGVGMPQRPDVDGSEIGDTGTALEAHVYGGRLSAYVTAQKPPDSDFSPENAEVVGQEGPFVVYYREGAAWKAFTAVSPEWQLSLILYPGAGHASVSWDKGDRAVAEWFKRALGRAQDNPPPCS